MLNALSPYQINALRQLAAYRKVFYEPGAAVASKKGKKEAVQRFIEIFCEHNFADTDYTIIQREPLEFDTVDNWISQASLPAILKTLTYYIWTDKILDGYFVSRIENSNLEKLLLRLEALLKEEKVMA